MRRWIATLGMLVCISSLPAEERDGDVKFKELMESRRYAEAADLSAVRVRKMPRQPARLFKAGHAHAMAGRHSEALGYFQELLEAEPDHLMAAVKAVQSMEALGGGAEMEPAIERARAIRRRLLARGEKIDAAFTRELFSAAGRTIMAREFFEPGGERALLWSFLVLDEKGKAARRISLGSYELNEASPDERLYHLDDSEGLSHWTLGIYREALSYREARKAVQEYLEGKTRAIARATTPRR